jgi:hypothetical protein
VHYITSSLKQKYVHNGSRNLQLDFQPNQRPKNFSTKKILTPNLFLGSPKKKKFFLPKVVCYEKLIQWIDLSFFISWLYLDLKAENLVTKPNRAKFLWLRFGSYLISRWDITWEYSPTNLSSFGEANFMFFWVGMAGGISDQVLCKQLTTSQFAF